MGKQTQYISRSRYFFFISLITIASFLASSLNELFVSILPTTQGAITIQFLSWAILVAIEVSRFNLIISRLKTLNMNPWLAGLSFVPILNICLGVKLLFKKETPQNIFRPVTENQKISDETAMFLVDSSFLLFMIYFSYVDFKTYTVPNIGLIFAIIIYTILNQFLLKREMFSLIMKFLFLGMIMVIFEILLKRFGYFIGAGDLILLSLLPLIEEGERLTHLLIQCLRVMIIGLGLVAFSYVNQIALVPFICIGYIIHLYIKYKFLWDTRIIPEENIFISINRGEV